MASDPFMVKVRLTKEQASVIWPGLDLIFQSYLIRSQTGRSSHIYPFGTYPLPYGYDTGSFSQEIMDRMRAFYDRLKPKARKGGRIQMDYIDLRVAILSVRVTVDFERERARKWRQCDDAAKRRLRVDRESIRRLEKKAQRVIKSLERKLKFANRRFLSRNSRYQYQSMSKQWSSHLRWIRFELAYSKPLPPITRGRKKWHQWLIDNLVALAEDVIRSEGYEIPDRGKLRHVMRLFAHYSRRFRSAAFAYYFDPRFVVKNPRNLNVRHTVLTFVEDHFELKEA
jgi:hypothetical protein